MGIIVFMATTGKKQKVLDNKKVIAAGLAVSKCTRKEIAKKVGKSLSTINKWFVDGNFQALVAKKTKDIENKIEQEIIKKTDILEKLKDVIDLDPADFSDKNGNIKEIHDMPVAARKLLSGFDVKEIIIESADGITTTANRTEKLKWYSLIDAIKEINKMLGYLAPVKGALTDTDGKDVPLRTPEEMESMKEIGRALAKGLVKESK